MTKDEVIARMHASKKKSIPYVQKCLKVSYNKAKRICDSVSIVKNNVYLDRMNEYLRKLNG